MADSIVNLIEQMRDTGVEQTISVTGRKIMLRSVDAEAFLKEGRMPDILTPLVIRSVFQDLDDDNLQDFLSGKEMKVEDALKHIEAIDFVVSKCIMDGTEVSDLTLQERRWIFRLVMLPSEILVTFRWKPSFDVEPLPEGNQVWEAAERDIQTDRLPSLMDA